MFVGTYKYEVDHQLKNFKSKHESRRILSSKYGRHQVRSLSPCGNKKLQMRIELAKLRKRYCDAQKELKRLNYRKYARSFSATRYKQIPATVILVFFFKSKTRITQQYICF